MPSVLQNSYKFDNDTIAGIDFFTSYDNPESNYIVIHPRDTKVKINEFIVKKILTNNRPDIAITHLQNEKQTSNDGALKIQGNQVKSAIECLLFTKIMNTKETECFSKALKELEDYVQIQNIKGKIVEYRASIKQYFTREVFERFMKQNTFDNAQVVLHCKKTAEFKDTTSHYKKTFIAGLHSIYKMYHGQSNIENDSGQIGKIVPNIKFQREIILQFLFTE